MCFVLVDRLISVNTYVLSQVTVYDQSVKVFILNR